jgi:hypothetical protein
LVDIGGKAAEAGAFVTGFGCDVEPKGVGDFVAIGGQAPPDAVAFGCGAPKGVGALVDIGGKAAEAGAFVTGFGCEVEPKGVGDFVAIGG